MDMNTAERLLAISAECTREMNESIRRVMENCDQETFKLYRSCGGKIMGYLFTEIVAPIQSEHAELAPLEFEAMETIEMPRLSLTKEIQGELVKVLNDQYARIGSMANVVHDKCDSLEMARYRGRIHHVLLYISEALACVLAARIELRST